MIIKNPNTKNLFYFPFNDNVDKMAVDNCVHQHFFCYDVDSSYLLRYVGMPRRSLLDNTYHRAYGNFCVGVQINSNFDVIYKNSNNALSFNFLKLTFNGNSVNYEECTIDDYCKIKDNGFVRFYFSCFKNADYYENNKEKIEILLNNIEKDFPELKIRNIFRSYSDIPWCSEMKGNESYQIIRIIAHNYYFQNNPKYRDLVNNGFIYLLSHNITGVSEKTFLKYINDWDSFCKNKKITELDAGIKSLIKKNSYATEYYLRLHYKCGLNYEQLKEFKRIYKTVGKNSVARFLTIKNLFPEKNVDELFKIIRRASSNEGKKSCQTAQFYKYFEYLVNHLSFDEILHGFNNWHLSDWKKCYDSTIAKVADEKLNRVIDSYAGLADFRREYCLPSTILHYRIGKISSYIDLYSDEADIAGVHSYGFIEPSEVIFRVEDILDKSKKVLLKFNLKTGAIFKLFMPRDYREIHQGFYNYDDLINSIKEKYLIDFMVDYSKRNSVLSDLI